MSTSQEDEQALERLLRAGRGDPDDAQLRRLEERFDTWLENAPLRRPPANGYAAATGMSGIRRIVPFVGVSLAVLGIAFFEVSSTGDGSASVREARRSSVEFERVGLANEPLRSARLSMHEPEVQPATRAPVAIVAPRPLVVSSNEPAHLPEPAPLPEPPSAAQLDPPSRVPVPASETSETSETEVSYLRRARAALKSDPAQALQLANGHPSRFPHGALDQEREIVAIDALVRLGRRSESRARANAFRARYPSSAHLTRLETLVGGSP